MSWIESTYLRDRNRSKAEIDAALLALSVQGNTSGAIPRERIIDAYRVFMSEHQEIAGLVAQDLASWAVLGRRSRLRRAHEIGRCASNTRRARRSSPTSGKVPAALRASTTNEAHPRIRRHAACDGRRGARARRPPCVSRNPADVGRPLRGVVAHAGAFRHASARRPEAAGIGARCHRAQHAGALRFARRAARDRGARRPCRPPHRVSRPPGHHRRRARARAIHGRQHHDDARAPVATVDGDSRVARQRDRDRRRVRRAWHRTHPAGLRSPAVRARVDDHRPQHARAGVDDHRIHARAFDHARAGDARSGSRAGSARGSGHCLLHPAARK